ncbi:unnamed protein product, partial [Polarella glacialis]
MGRVGGCRSAVVPVMRPLIARESRARQFSSARAPVGRLQVLHTQLLLRGGARTPLQPLQPESFWKATLPDKALLQRLTRGGGGGGSVMGSGTGPRRRQIPFS